MEELLRFQKNLKFIVWDLETCNLNLLQDNHPWQLSFSVCEGNRVVEEHDLFPFWADLQMGKGAAQITRFNYHEYKRKSSDATACLDLFESYAYNKDYLLVGHNILGFDCYVHQIYRQLLGRPKDYSYMDRCIDTNILAKSLKLDMKPDGDRLSWQYRLGSIIRKGLKTNLALTAKEQSIPYDKNMLHSGSYDIGINRQVFLKLIQVVDI